MASNIVNRRAGLDATTERALFRGTVGEAAAVEFSAFLKVWRELPHPRAVIDDPQNAVVPANASALIALCGSLYRVADDISRLPRGRRFGDPLLDVRARRELPGLVKGFG